MTYEEMLKEFHQKYDHFIYFGYETPREVKSLRIKLIEEEVNKELLPLLYLYQNTDQAKDWSTEAEKGLLTQIADGIADSIYVLVGTAVAFGIPIDLVFEEVHRSNMTKSIQKNEYGKTVKGLDWEPPKIREIIEEAFK